MPSVLSRVLESKLLTYSGLILVATFGAALAFPGGPSRIFSATEFLPHATCYLQNRNLITLHVITDLLIGCAYVSISTTLGYLVWRASKDIPFHWMFLAFGLFIISCGFTNFMEVWTVWQSVYWLAGYVKAITAAASVVTAIALFPLVPRVFALIDSVKVSEDRRRRLEETSAELAAANQRLQDRRRELEIANRELEMFNYSVAHDLRSPLRGMRGFAEALKEDYCDRLDATAQTYGQKIMGAADHMDRLLCDLLSYSKMSREEIHLKPVDLKPLIERVLSDFSEKIRDRNARVEMDLAVTAVQADATFMHQVLSNLINNALHYVARDVAPQIQIKSEKNGGSVRVSIKDNGVGIDPKYHRVIFRLFERLDSESPGTGLGLAIVQRAVERMGGKIGVDSAVGKGALFWIELPDETPI